MRILFVPASLLLIAWSAPAGTLPQQTMPDNPAAMSVADKSVDGADASVRIPAGTTGAAPAETTDDLDSADVSFDYAPTTETPLLSDALGALDAVAREPGLAAQEAVPLPPHRAISHAQVCEELASAAENNDLPAPFLIRLIWQESGFNQNAVSRVGAQGVAQFMPETAAQRGLLDPFNPLQAVHASAQLLRDLFHQFGNLGLAAAAYNAGPRRVQSWLDRRSKLPQETRDYVQRITGRAPEQWKGTMTAAPIRVPAAAPCQRQAGLFAANGPRVIPMPPVAPDSANPLTGTSVRTRIAALAEPTGKGTHPREATPAKKAITAKAGTNRTAAAKTAATKFNSVKIAATTHAASQTKAQAKVQAKAQAKAQDKAPDKKVRLAEAGRSSHAK
jgi:hypothetical protein